MIQRSKIDVILRSFWKTSFVTFLREMSGKDWNPIFRIDGLFFPIGHSRKYHNTLCLSPQILHKHCFQFLLGLIMAPRENKNNAYAYPYLGGQTKNIMVFSGVANTVDSIHIVSLNDF